MAYFYIFMFCPESGEIYLHFLQTPDVVRSVADVERLGEICVWED